MPFVDRAIARLAEDGARLTAPRRLLLESLPERDGFRADDLWQRARRLNPGLGRATVFRALELFARLGIVDRLDDNAGAPQYRVCLTDRNTDHHHLLCVRCRAGVEVEDTEIEPLLAALSARRGYLLTQHHLELFGLCPSCRSQ